LHIDQNAIALRVADIALIQFCQKSQAAFIGSVFDVARLRKKHERIAHLFVVVDYVQHTVFFYGYLLAPSSAAAPGAGIIIVIFYYATSPLVLFPYCWRNSPPPILWLTTLRQTAAHNRVLRTSPMWNNPISNEKL
jgi:hypothetical protein